MAAPHETIRKILDFLPDIGAVDQNIEFTAHNVTQKPIQGLRDLNQEKVDQLSSLQIDEINHVLSRHQGLLNFFQYQMIATG